ncbi:GntR family transcriptional regulator / MocR family aminotransferase [Sinosporangium album]|uniref:GntR family transcriptional regulator / MocR family aminotransferase n=1 Tax=Sinosporangium album TaxID=504805 RepID=A0A1G7XZ52_9ACTN|nr:PLP-dependent aminotransferase family protein [Sinosporangium album]SDG89411.1 GntR family transcriptional regulator / MocR family aminotransferase [Sinosporangium album]
MADLHLAVDRAAGGIAGQIARELRGAIRSGRLVADVRLPASRELAKDLGVSRGVVVEAYEQLVAEGFLLSRVGAGTFVAPLADAAVAVPDQVRPRRPVLPPYRPTSPELSAFPRERWLASVRHALATMPVEAFDYADPGGVRELREEIAAYLGRVRAAAVTPDTVVVVGGVVQGLTLTLRALGPGARLAVEDPAGHRQNAVITAIGVTTVPVPVDDEGIDVAALRAVDVDAVLVTPAHQYPTGVVLSPARRTALAAWAADTGAVIIEDDYNAEFRFDREPVGCLQGLAPASVVLTGSVSKSLAPGLRLGWVAAPPHLARAVRRARALLDLGSPVIDQYALAHFIAVGSYDRHLRRMRREYRIKRDALVGALRRHLPQVRPLGVSAGMHACLELPPHWDERAVAKAATACGLPAEPLAIMRTRPGPPALVVGFGRLPPRRADEVVAALAADLPDDHRPSGTSRSRPFTTVISPERLTAPRMETAEPGIVIPPP